MILPVCVSSPDPTPSEPAPVASSVLERRGRILVIDDEPLVGRAIEAALSPEHEVVVVGRAADAFARFADGATFDVILCDVLMPQFGGSEVYARLLAEWPHMASRVVFMTGDAFTPESRDFLERASQRLLWKPFTIEELRAIVGAQMDEQVVRTN